MPYQHPVGFQTTDRRKPVRDTLEAWIAQQGELLEDVRDFLRSLLLLGLAILALLGLAAMAGANFDPSILEGLARFLSQGPDAPQPDLLDLSIQQGD